MPTLTPQKRIATSVLRNTKSVAGGVLAGTPLGKKENGSADSGAKGKLKHPNVRRWMAAGLILGTALLTVAFVANAIKVNELLGAITSVEAERDAVGQQNERLRAELLRLMSVEQVTSRAVELGLVQPEVPPIALPLRNAASEIEQQKNNNAEKK